MKSSPLFKPIGTSQRQSQVFVCRFEKTKGVLRDLTTWNIALSTPDLLVQTKYQRILNWKSYLFDQQPVIQKKKNPKNAPVKFIISVPAIRFLFQMDSEGVLTPLIDSQMIKAELIHSKSIFHLTSSKILYFCCKLVFRICKTR